ncbi:hypothetical protein cypCar_00012127 [Cyprinus carpio]|nr:hypothetical protein cypCar_00012127 [Cyprinus carpio]
MDNRRRHRESPVRDVKTKIKQEKLSPARPPRLRRSGSGSSRGSSSPPPRRRDSRLVEFTRADGTTGRRVKPYIIDLGSGNGTYLNNQRIEPQRYYELKEKDVLKFGFSSREYVLLHEFSDTAEVDAKKEEEEDEGLDE